MPPVISLAPSPLLCLPLPLPVWSFVSKAVEGGAPLECPLPERGRVPSPGLVTGVCGQAVRRPPTAASSKATAAKYVGRWLRDFSDLGEVFCLCLLNLS